jgi:hypothetical protein
MWNITVPGSKRPRLLHSDRQGVDGGAESSDAPWISPHRLTETMRDLAAAAEQPYDVHTLVDRLDLRWGRSTLVH